MVLCLLGAGSGGGSGWLESSSGLAYASLGVTRAVSSMACAGSVAAQFPEQEGEELAVRLGCEFSCYKSFLIS